MNHVIITSKHNPIVYEASPTSLIEFSEEPGVDVMPIELADFVAPGVGYCAISLKPQPDGTFLPEQIVGFVTQKGTIQVGEDEYDQLRHLTILEGWQSQGLATKLVTKATQQLHATGSHGVAARVNAESKKPFSNAGFAYTGTVMGLTGVYKAIYVHHHGQPLPEKVE